MGSQDRWSDAAPPGLSAAELHEWAGEIKDEAAATTLADASGTSALRTALDGRYQQSADLAEDVETIVTDAGTTRDALDARYTKAVDLDTDVAANVGVPASATRAALDGRYLPGSSTTGPNGTQITTVGDLRHESEPGHTVELDFSQIGYGIGPVIHGRYAGGTKASPTAPPSGTLLWGIGCRPWTGTAWTDHSTAALHWVAEENISGTNQGTSLRLLVTPLGQTWENRLIAIHIGPDGILDRIAVPTAQAYKSATSQSLTTATYAAVTFDAEAWDNNAIHSTASNTSRMVAPQAGKYRVTATIAFEGNTTGYRAINFRVNGDTNQRFGSQTANPVNGATLLTTSTELNLAANDYVEVWAFQNSGGALNVLSETASAQPGTTRLTMTYIGA